MTRPFTIRALLLVGAVGAACGCNVYTSDLLADGGESTASDTGGATSGGETSGGRMPLGDDGGTGGTANGGIESGGESGHPGTAATGGTGAMPDSGGAAWGGSGGGGSSGLGGTGAAGAGPGTGGAATGGAAEGGEGGSSGSEGTAGSEPGTGGFAGGGGVDGSGGVGATGGAPMGGTGGTGAAATGGISGAGGATGGAPTGGTGGAPTGGTGGAPTGGTGGAIVTGPCESASGVVVLTVPLAAVGEGQRYNYQNYDGADGTGSYDLTGSVLNIEVCAPAATGGNLHVFFTTPDRSDSAAVDIALSSLTSEFQTISVPVPDASGSFDPGTIMVTRIEVEAGSGFGTSWQQPATVVVIDRISTSNGLFDDSFTADTHPLGYSGARPLDGATIAWAAAYSGG